MAADPGGPFVARRHDRATVLARLTELLPAGEVVRGVFGVAKIRPALDTCVVTSTRIWAGWLDGVAERGWVHELRLDDLARAEVTGIMDNVRLVHRDGTSTKLGNLAVQDDVKELFLQVVLAAQWGEAAPPEPEPPAGGPTWEVYRP